MTWQALTLMLMWRLPFVLAPGLAARLSLHLASCELTPAVPGSELEAICCVVSQVRDRATLYLAELDGLAGGPAAITVQWNIPAKNLEKSLRAYLENGPDAPFDLVSAVFFAPL